MDVNYTDTDQDIDVNKDITGERIDDYTVSAEVEVSGEPVPVTITERKSGYSANINGEEYSFSE